ncbi:MAG: PHP domain-containing protein [Planctomycetes bacterium]|jgi:hypothetical protein|nr:PHP domain-containing protein [Planctomycetota bacterium]
MLIDLQLHSTYSDGYLTPTDLAKLLARWKVKVASLTDHNTVGGWDEFRLAAKAAGIKPIIGLELYVRVNGRFFNILWYNFDWRDAKLHELLRESQARRRGQLRNALDKLAARGFKLNINKVLDQHNHYVPINRAVDEILTWPENRRRIKRELGVAEPREEHIISAYFKNRRSVFLHESRISLERIAALRERIGGFLVWCHPAKYGAPRFSWLEGLKQAGLDGVEVMSPHHNLAATMELQQWARENKLIATGGSDFHRYEGGYAKIQHAWQYYQIDSRYLPSVVKIIG